MKVLIISNYQDAINAVRAEGAIFIELQKIGLDIHIMTDASAPFVKYFKAVGISIYDYQPQKKISLAAIRKIRTILKKERFDILHLFNSKAVTNGCFAAIGLPVKVLTYRGVLGITHWYNPNSYLKHLHPRVDGITAASKAIQQYLQQQLFWNKQKVTQFYKGQDLTWYEGIRKADLAQIGIPPNAFVITCVANHRRVKGLPLLIQAAQFLPPTLPIHFLLIGRNTEHPQLAALVQQNAYNNKFHILGYRADALNWVAASTIYVQPSLQEGLGKSILEAMSLGIPTIVTDCGGPTEFVSHQESGLVVPINNPKAIADAILQLFDTKRLRAKLGVGAKKTIEEKMNLQNGVLQLKNIYEKTIIP